MKQGLSTNIEEVFTKFCDMAQEDMTRSIRNAIRKGAKMLQSQTKQNLNSVIKDRGHKRKEPFFDTIDDGVRVTKVYENDENDLEAKVHILGTRAKGSGTYRLRFLEKGTKIRYNRTRNGKDLKTPRYVGAIKPRWFFRAANQSVLPQLQGLYMSEISKSVERINNTK